MIVQIFYYFYCFLIFIRYISVFQVLTLSNKDGQSPLYLAIKEKKQNIVDYLNETKNKQYENEIPKETYSNKDPCIICFKPRNELYALVPCGHTSLCETCCIKVKLEPHSKCPSCRKAIKSYMKIFFQVPK